MGTPGILILWLSDTPVGKTTAGFVAGTYWFLMLVGRLLGASLGSKISSKTMLASVSTVGLILVLAAIFSPTTTQVAIPALQTSATGALSFGMAQVPINAMFLVIIGLCTSIMWEASSTLPSRGWANSPRPLPVSS